MRALVLGASGHVGNAITRELLARGWEVTATSRQPQPALNLAGLPLRYRCGDSDREGQLEEWIRGHDLVIDAAAPYAFWLKREESADRIAALARARMQQLLASVGRHGARLAYVSSFTTLPSDRRGLDAAQGALLRRLHPYFELKREMESQVCEAARIGLPAAVVNPSLCLGPYDLKAPQFCMIPVTLRGELPAVNSHPINVIDVRDVAVATLTAVEREYFGDPILLSGHNSTVDSLTATICRLGGAEPPSIHVPPQVPAVAAYGNEVLGTLGLSNTPYPSVGMLLLLEQRWMTADPRMRELLPRPRPLSRTIVEAIDWYRDVGYLDADSSSEGTRAATGR